MKKRWINCTELLKYHDVPPAESVQAIIRGKIDAYSSQLRKIVNVRHYELKKNTRDAILSEIDILEQETGKRPLVSFAPDAAHVGEFLGAGADKLIKNRWDNNIPTYYIIHPHGTLPINLGWLESILQNPSRKAQCEELSFIQFKYEDAVRCFGLAPAEDAPAPVAVEQDNPAEQGTATPSTETPGRTTIDQGGDVPVAENQDLNGHSLSTTPVHNGVAAEADAWGEIHIVFVGDYAVEIHYAGTFVNKTFDELKFSDGRRKDEPNSLWILLKTFAENRGEISPNNDISKQVSNLRKALKSNFPHIEGDPIGYQAGRRTYTTVFTISSRIPRE